jgi:uncharacterized protein YkwD
MRLVSAGATVGAWACVSCSAGINQSNGSKLGEALAFAAIAGATQVALSAAEQQARNNAPVTHASKGLGVAHGCDNDDEYACVTVRAAPSAPRVPEPEMDDDEARAYVLGYVNGVRRLNGVGPLLRDESLDAFAQAGSVELSLDHRPNRHMSEHVGDLHAVSAEVQGLPDGSGPGPLQDRIAEILLRWMNEGPGGADHDTLLRPVWRNLGVGIANRDGRTFFTVDFSAAD